MASFGFFRTIWITLRAANYTTRAFGDTIKGLKKLEQQQLQFKMNAQRNIMAVGIMYLAFAGIAVQTISRIVSASKYGQRMLENFGIRISKSMARLGDTLARLLEPILNVIASLLEIATANPILRMLLSLVIMLGTAFLVWKGVTMMLSGAIGMLSIQMSAKALATKAATTSLMAWIPTAKVATASAISLGTAINWVFAGFAVGLGLVMAIYSAFGKLPAIIAAVTIAVIALAVALWSAAGGLSVLTFGAAAIAGGAAIAGAIVASQPEFAMGTSFVRKGGLAVVHEGEEIRSARESRVQPRMETRQFQRTTTHINVTMGDVYTKTDKENLVPMMKRALKEALDEKA